MHVQLDPEFLLASINLWKESVDREIPQEPDIRANYIEQNRQSLQGFIDSANAWLLMLSVCDANGEDLQQLKELAAHVDAFQTWSVQMLGYLKSVEELEVAQREVQRLKRQPTQSESEH